MGEPIRQCGSCSACCTVIAVHEIEKGPHETCEHLCGAGCAIYAERPGSCRTFQCQWLRGALEADGAIDPELRPDACGVMFDYQPATAFGEVFTAWEVEPGASANGDARVIIEGLAESFLVMVVACGRDGEKGVGERSFVGPPHLVAEATDLMWSRPADREIRPKRWTHEEVRNAPPQGWPSRPRREAGAASPKPASPDSRDDGRA